MQQSKVELQTYTRPEEEVKSCFENLITAMKNDLFRLNITNDAGERVYVAGVEYIENGINISITDGTEFKLIRG